MNLKLELSVILPAYNESQDIERTLGILKEKFDSLQTTYEILVINDGSKDGTLEKARRCEGRTIKILTYDVNRGKGFAVRHGMAHAAGEYRLFMDVDLSTSLDAVDDFLRIMRQGEYDILMGDRKSKAAKKINQPWARRFFGGGFTRLSGWCVGRAFADFTCGFKMFNRKATEIIFSRQKVDNWSFDTEILYIALKYRLKIREIPVNWNHHPGSNVRLIRDILTSLYGLLKIRFYALSGAYK